MSVGQGVVWLLVAVFLWAGTLNLLGPAFVRNEFARWGYPSALRIAVGCAELAAALMLVAPATRPMGGALATLVLAGVIVSLWRTREWMRMEYPLILGALTVLILVPATRA
jgi:uncharacterized membrane protein YphA (DoxX/SURF4 family)